MVIRGADRGLTTRGKVSRAQAGGYGVAVAQGLVEPLAPVQIRLATPKVVTTGLGIEPLSRGRDHYRWRRARTVAGGNRPQPRPEGRIPMVTPCPHSEMGLGRIEPGEIASQTTWLAAAGTGRACFDPEPAVGVGEERRGPGTQRLRQIGGTSSSVFALVAQRTVQGTSKPEMMVRFHPRAETLADA